MPKLIVEMKDVCLIFFSYFCFNNLSPTRHILLCRILDFRLYSSYLIRKCDGKNTTRK